MKSTEEINTGQTGETITRCWSDNATPSKRGRRQKNADKSLLRPILPPLYALSPASSSTGSVETSFVVTARSEG